jgi:hypothetical protein
MKMVNYIELEKRCINALSMLISNLKLMDKQLGNEYARDIDSATDEIHILIQELFYELSMRALS